MRNLLSLSIALWILLSATIISSPSTLTDRPWLACVRAKYAFHKKVLETCAGSNRNLKYYKAGVNLTLIDFSPNMVSVGSSKVSPFVKYNYVNGDVMNMPFKDD